MSTFSAKNNVLRDPAENFFAEMGLIRRRRRARGRTKGEEETARGEEGKRKVISGQGKGVKPMVEG